MEIGFLFPRTAVRRLATGVLALVIAGSAAGCATGLIPASKTTAHGYVISEIAIEQVPVGSSKEQALIALGSPSTTGNFGSEAFYYISQTRKQSVEFMPSKLVDQRILAVYFDKDEKVVRIANYGLKDGKVFDFIGRTTPTGGSDQNFLSQVLTGVLSGHTT